MSVQNRTVALLAVNQVVAGISLGTMLALGSVVGVELSGREGLAGIPTTVVTLGAALAGIPLAALAARRGRRISLSTGLLIAAVGFAIVIAGIALESFVVFLVGVALSGAGSAVNLQSRFAATDLSMPHRRGRDMSVVVWTTTVGAVIGPNLIEPGASLARSIGLPVLAGPYVFAAAGLVVAAVMLWAGLRPDPLLLARELHGAPASTSKDSALTIGVAIAQIRSSPAATLAVMGLVAAMGTMVAVMSMTPLHLQHIPVGLETIGFAMSMHIAGMFVLAPVMGVLCDRMGRVETLLLGQGIFYVALAFCALGRNDHVLVTLGLILLGLGWSASTIACSTLLTESVALEVRAKAQGVTDTATGLAGAVGGGLAGLLVSVLGYVGLNIVAAVVVTLVVVAALAFRRAVGSPSPVVVRTE